MKKLLAILLLGMAFAGQITERVYMTPTANGKWQSATMQIIGSGNIISANNTQGITVKPGVGNFNVPGTVSANQSQFNQQPVAIVKLATSFVATANQEKRLTFDTEISDVSDMYSTATGLFTATSNGTYMFSTTIGVNGAIGSIFYIYIAVDGTKGNYSSFNHTASQRDFRTYTEIFKLNAGQTISVRYECSQAETIEGNVTGQQKATFASFVKLF